MMAPPRCFTRGCKWYIGVHQPNEDEMSERLICVAYPEGIPGDIAYGDSDHLEVRDDQDNEVVFELLEK